MQGLNKELQDVIAATEADVKNMNRQQIVSQLNELQKVLSKNLSEFSYPASFDQESVYRDMARLKTEFLKAQAVQNILIKHALTK